MSNGDKLFLVYVHTLIRDQLLNIIEQFHGIIGLQQICDVIDGTHIHLSLKPYKHITSSTTIFYYRKCFHNIMLQVVCDYDMVFWNACVGQPSGMANGGQFKMSNLYCSLRSRQILQKPIVNIEGVQIQRYLLGDATYPIWPYLLKCYKPRNSDMVYQIQFDQSMNKGRVLIKNAFESSKNRWKIFKKFNVCVDQAPMITLAYCTLHNFCQLQGMPKPVVHNVQTQGDPFMGFASIHISIP